MAKTKVLICPYCGDTQAAGERCRVCGGLFEPLSRQATHNAMGPWFIRDGSRPFQPGCSYETLLRLVERKQVDKHTIIRGPTTKQFWTIAKRVPGVAHLLGYCHHCDASVDPGDHGCHSCGVPFGAYLDRNYLGLPDVKPLPWEVDVDAERSGASGVRGLDWQRAAEPIGISSFASDAELLGRGQMTPVPFPPSSMPMRPISPSSIEPTGFPQTSPSMPEFRSVESAAPALLEPGGDPAINAAATRAMQRRLTHQQRTIRLMTLTIVGLAVIAAIALIVVLARGGSDPAGSPAPATQKAAPSDAQAQPAETPSNAVDEQPSPNDDSGSVPLNTEDSDSTSASTTPLNPVAAYRGEYERALAIIDRAKQADHPLEEQIKDYEEAVAVLENIAANAPDEAKPDDLAGRIEDAKRELERLKLKSFFP